MWGLVLPIITYRAQMETFLKSVDNMRAGSLDSTKIMTFLQVVIFLFIKAGLVRWTGLYD
jgi:hypothetical protein